MCKYGIQLSNVMMNAKLIQQNVFAVSWEDGPTNDPTNGPTNPQQKEPNTVLRW